MSDHIFRLRVGYAKQGRLRHLGHLEMLRTIERCVRMVKEGKVTARSGKDLDISGDTLCVHGDGPKALAFVRKIRERFTQEGIEIVSFQNRA